MQFPDPVVHEGHLGLVVAGGLVSPSLVVVTVPPPFFHVVRVVVVVVCVVVGTRVVGGGVGPGVGGGVGGGAVLQALSQQNLAPPGHPFALDTSISRVLPEAACVP